MGLWGGIKSTLGKIGGTEGMSFQDRISVVRAMQSDDPMAAYRVRKDIRDSKREDEERFRVRAGLEQEGLPGHAIDIIMADPKRPSEFMLERYKTRHGGSESMGAGSIDPATGELKTQSSAGWQNGDNSRASDWSKGPQRLRSGEQVLPADGGGYPRPYGGPQTDLFRTPGFGDGARRGPYDIPGLGAGIAGKLHPFPSRTGEPAPGAAENGYRFKRGNPADPDAWERAGGAGLPDWHRFGGSFGR